MAAESANFLLYISITNLMTVLLHVQSSYASGSNITGESNFQILLGDVQLGQLPELWKVATLEDVHVFVSDEQQTAVVTNGVNIRLDWSRWVNETLTGSAANGTFTFRRTQLNETGGTIGNVSNLNVSNPPERIVVGTNKDANEFFVEITCVVVSGQSLNGSERAIYELEACVQNTEMREECFYSNITVYGIETPVPLDYECLSGGVGGRVDVLCRTNNHPIASRTCTVSGDGVLTAIPCDTESTIRVSVADFHPGSYDVIVNATDVYGQTVTITMGIPLSAPLLNGWCILVELDVFCMTSVDNVMVTVTYICSYDQGPPLPCGRNISIDKRSFNPGFHELSVTFNSEDGQTFTSRPIIFNIKAFELQCSVDRSRPHTINCVGVNGDTDQIYCVYDEDVGPDAVRESCELPIIVDYTHYDDNGGYHNITVVANSTIGESAVFIDTVLLDHIECVQLTEPGSTVVVCATRVEVIDTPLCVFPNLIEEVPCTRLSNILITASDFPLQIGSNLLFVSGNYIYENETTVRARVQFSVNISETQMVECSTTLNCSSNGTLMSARECCVNSEEGLAYTIPGNDDKCHTCFVFGWYLSSYTGMEQDDAHTVLAGFLKGGEQAGFDLTMNIDVTFTDASSSDISLKQDSLVLRSSDPAESVLFTFIVDGISEGNESFSLNLVPLASTLQTMPNGEAVYFLSSLELTIMDADVPVSSSLNIELIGSLVGVGSFLLILGIVLIIICLCYYLCTTKKKQERYKIGKKIEDNSHYALASQIERHETETSILSVQSTFKLDLSPHLIIPSASIKLNETIGQGEFGIVYKGYIMKGQRHSFEEYLAIKTLKGFYDHTMVRDMLKECSRMSTFNHPNVLTLKGVCLDGGPAPYIIMPYMANGSLLTYLKGNRKTLIATSEDVKEDVDLISKQLLDMCHQVAKGMDYLASMKVVHRDLAARNCMIDTNFVIKVADFGLSESVGTKEYFRQDENSPIKLPLKWLPPESINDYVFSEKSDVWAYGITCWEIFSGGKVPYSEFAVRDIPKQLADGYRLERPVNEACSDDMYSLMHECWLHEPEGRPTFLQLVNSLSEILESMAGYVDVGAFGIRDSVLEPPGCEKIASATVIEESNDTQETHL